MRGKEQAERELRQRKLDEYYDNIDKSLNI